MEGEKLVQNSFSTVDGTNSTMASEDSTNTASWGGAWGGYGTGTEQSEGREPAPKRVKVEEKVVFKSVWACPRRDNKDDPCQLCGGVGCPIEAIKPINRAEYFIVVLERTNGSNKYLCPDCGHRFQGTPQRIIAHKLRIHGRGVAPCGQEATEVAKKELGELEESSMARAKPHKRRKSCPVGSVIDLASIPDDMPMPKGGAGMAIARFMYECDLQFYLANHPAFKRMIRAVAVAGPSFQPPDADQITNLLTGDLKSRGKRGPGPRSQIAESQEARKDPAPM
mmetsp:Transcript_36656/g.86203  ORF Transcript_36656/g.86203 Transcript_36656/m.86203 type:complete len:281 (+) Transcript_36656:262-1104(+)